MSLKWDTEAVRQQLRGLKKMTLKAMAGNSMKELARLTGDMVGGVVNLADVLLKNDEFVVAHFMPWFFLCWVQTECWPCRLALLMAS